MLTNLAGCKISFETIEGVSVTRREGYVYKEIVAECTYEVYSNGKRYTVDYKQIKAILDLDTMCWMSRTEWERAHSKTVASRIYNKLAKEFCWSADPKKVIFNGPATIVLWKDNTKTIVKRREGEEDDREKAIMYCILKKLCGKKAAMDRYLKQFFKEVESNEEKAD